MSKTINGFVRLRADELADFRPRTALAIEIDLGPGWPSIDAQFQVQRVAYWAESVTVVGDDPNAVAYVVKSVNEYLAAQAGQEQAVGGAGG